MDWETARREARLKSTLSVAHLRPLGGRGGGAVNINGVGFVLKAAGRSPNTRMSSGYSQLSLCVCGSSSELPFGWSGGSDYVVVEMDGYA